MSQYQDVTKFLAEHEPSAGGTVNERRKWSEVEILSLEKEHPGVPGDYLSYLSEVGSGAFLDCQYVTYDGFIKLNEIFTNEQLETKGERVLCFGDNFCRDPAGFLPDDHWSIVEVWHDSLTIHRTGQSFGEFIRKQIFACDD